MTVSEALENYNNTKSKYCLYENLYYTKLKFKEIKLVLQDTLRENFSEEDFSQWFESQISDDNFIKRRAEILDKGVDSYELIREMIRESGNVSELLKFEESEGHLREAKGDGTFPTFKDWEDKFNKDMEKIKLIGNVYNDLLFKRNHLQKGQIFYGLSRNTFDPICKTRPHIVYSDEIYSEDGEYVYAMPLMGDHSNDWGVDASKLKRKNPLWYMPLPTPFEVGRIRKGDSVVGNYNYFTDGFYGDIGVFYHEKVEGLPKFRVAKKYITSVPDTYIFSSVQTLIDKKINSIEATRKKLDVLMQKILQKYRNNEIQPLPFILGDYLNENTYGLYGLREEYHITDEGLLNVLKLNFSGTNEEYKEISSLYTETIKSPEAQRMKGEEDPLPDHTSFIWQVSDDQNTRRGFPQKVLVKPVVKKKLVLKKNDSST